MAKKQKEREKYIKSKRSAKKGYKMMKENLEVLKKICS